MGVLPTLVLLGLSAAATPSGAQVAPECTAPAHGAPTFDAGRLRQGRFTHRVTVDGKTAGKFVVEIRRQRDGSWRFTGDAIGFYQHWEALTTARFEPKSALLSLTRKGRPYRMELAYAGGRVEAIEWSTNEIGALQVRRSTSPIEGPTVDQRIDWASMMASSLEPRASASYRVFDASTGSSVLNATASEGPVMQSPIGRARTIRLAYTICKAGRVEPYVVYATRGRRRLMVREDLRGNEVGELIGAAP